MILQRPPTILWLGINDPTETTYITLVGNRRSYRNNLHYTGWESMILHRQPTLHWLGINDPTDTTCNTVAGNQ